MKKKNIFLPIVLLPFVSLSCSSSLPPNNHHVHHISYEKGTEVNRELSEKNRIFDFDYLDNFKGSFDVVTEETRVIINSIDGFGDFS